MLDEGMFLASRSAMRAVGTKDGEATRHAYDLRSRTRTTPHGVFAGVAAAALTSPAAVMRLGNAHQAVTTLNPAWLTAVTSRLLHEEPELLPTLTLTHRPPQQVSGVMPCARVWPSEEPR